MKLRDTAIFRLLATTTILFYCAALAQAGQIITEEHRSWAKQKVRQEGQQVGEATAPNSIAVLNVNNKSEQARLNFLQKGLALMLITDLAKVEQIQVIERVRMQALLDEIGIGDSGPENDETTIRVGKLLGVNYSTSGDILADEAKYFTIEPSVYEIPFEQIASLQLVVGTLDDLYQLEKEILFQIIQLMNIDISPEKKAELEVPMSTDTDALLYFFQGIDYSDKLQYAEAAEMYNQALMKDPDMEMAASALQELKDMGLLAASEEIPMLEEGAPPPEAEEGLSMGAMLGIGAAAVAAVGAGAYLYENQKDDDDSPPVNPDTLRPPSIESVAPDEGTTLNCLSGSVTFVFSEPMLQVGKVYITANDSNLDHFFNIKESWEDQWDNVNFTVSWEHPLSTSQYCQDDNTKVIVNISLSNFQDLTGSALNGKKRFSFDGKNFSF